MSFGTMDDERWNRTLDGGLVLRATDNPHSPLLQHFMAGYDRAFILPDEREELAGFQACLALNPASRHRFGRTHCEMVMTIDDAASGTLLGGANFLATHIPAAPDGYPPVAVALNYLFVEPAARGRGLSRVLKQAVGELANQAVDCATTMLPALFIEQNDPLKLTEAEYAADSAHSGIDQVDRLAIWARLGARLIDFPYVQPALSADQQSDDGLAYAVLNFSGDAIDPRWFAAHLESFFGISVLKGRDPHGDPAAGAQLSLLQDMAAKGRDVPLRSLAEVVAGLRAQGRAQSHASLCDYARSL